MKIQEHSTPYSTVYPTLSATELPTPSSLEPLIPSTKPVVSSSTVLPELLTSTLPDLLTSKMTTPLSRKNHLIFTPDIHDGTRIDLVSSILSLNQSILISSNKPHLPRYYRSPYPIYNTFNPQNPDRQLVNPTIPVLKRDSPVIYTTESFLQKNYLSVRNHEGFAQADCVVCMFYPSICQFYIPFNKTIVFLPAHRFLLKRCNRQQNNKLIKWMFDYPNQILTIAASVYDREYINYFTGKTVPIIYSSSLFAYPQPAKYSPKYSEILVAPLRLKDVPYYKDMMEGCRRNNISCEFTTLKSKVGDNWKFEALYRFKAVIVFPYAMLSYYLNDLMASCVPMFVPSPQFLANLGCVRDYRNSDKYYCKSKFTPPARSPLTKHPYSPEDGSFAARVYWYQFATFYTNAATQFDSWDDLGAKLRSTDLEAKFRERRQENIRIMEHNTKEWNKVFGKIRNGTMPSSYNEALKEFNVQSFF